MEELLKDLARMQLMLLDDDWAQDIYSSEFLEMNDLPPGYENLLESLDINTIFDDLIKSIDLWLSDETSNEEKSWASLSHHVEHLKLLAILAYHIDYGSKNILTMEYRNSALLSSHLYIKLLTIPGYKAYHIYHSQLFAHSVGCLSFPKVLCDSANTNVNIPKLIKEVNFLIKKLQDFILDLRSVIESMQLNPTDMNFEDIMGSLIEMAGGATACKLNIDKMELAKMTEVIYEIIDILICDLNKEPNAVATQILFKSLLPKLVAASLDGRYTNNIIRASYVSYAELLISKYGKVALTGFNVLMQHLCYNLDGLERAEIRNARVSLIIGLMTLLPSKSFSRFVKWLLKLTSTSKILHRQISLEVLSKLLNNDPEETANENIVPTFSDTGNTQESSNQTQNGTVTTEALHDQLQSNVDGMVTDDSQEPAEEFEENTEEEDTFELQQRARTVSHSNILRAVYERVNDVSSTLRTRALTILTECLDSECPPVKNAIKELNGNGEVGRLSAVAARCVCDERAAVRRAAVSLVHKHLAVAEAESEATTSATDYAILVGLCRDASIMVRSAAISAIGDLAASYPNVQTLDAFISGPVHQLSDPETKIQEQVVSLVQQLLIERLHKHAASGCTDQLPWEFLAAIARHNKRRHLQKACAMLVKSAKCINQQLVHIVSSQLGVGGEERDLQCLVLLTSVARHVDYTDVGFVLDYYYRLTDDSQCSDSRLMPLTLELASTWAQQASAPARLALRDHLVRRLAASTSDDGCRIASAKLAVLLDPNNLQWATELMQIAERRALNGGQVEEWVRAADLSLVAPVPPSSALLQLFITAITDPPPEWDEARLGAAVAGAGRLCVRSRDAATAVAGAFATLLHAPSASPTARINSVLALTDICIRYTCIVEPLLGSVCSCLSVETAPPLRRVTVRALTRLLLAGYLRLRTPLYYRFCALLADEDADVREPAEYYVTCCLTTDTIYHHFVECVLYYNKDDTESISFDARQLIYDVMLQRLSVVQRLNVQCRLAREVLEHAADVTDEGRGDTDLPAALNAALLDTITLLCGPRMKLPRKPVNSGDPADIDDLQERVTTNIVSHKMKRTVAEVLVPAVLRLYARLRSRGGQLAAYLVRIATDLLNDYRQEIEELIDNDEELVERVRQFQETIGLEPSFGNARNLVTASAPPEADTPITPRRRPRPRLPPHSARKRALRI